VLVEFVFHSATRFVVFGLKSSFGMDANHLPGFA